MKGGGKGRKGGAKGRKGKKYPISKGLGGVPDVASLTEVISNKAQTGAFYNTNNSYRLYDLSLNSCPRATLVGQAYQEFRMRRITLVYKTTTDSFIGGNYAVPNLYYMIDKKGAVPANFTVDTLAQMGAILRRIDDKTIKVQWAPAVLQASLTDPTALSVGVASAQISPWLPTNNSPGAVGLFQASDVDHFGLSWIVYVPVGATSVPYDVDIFVDFEFRKPRWNTPEAPPPGSLALNWNQRAESQPSTASPTE
ncbi:coat protein [Lake Sarah-associated circular virus-13]|uniref:coat protein n=1 Tax=Lake Sarah-associated circular virus-13 TaxID=1685739 RepID=UPI0007772BC5|nr:coat protein [Lake Sarah-associated circular virus-13]ALE29614.1 coat protein [Lake Sarah-associated circular virus-13]